MNNWYWKDHGGSNGFQTLDFEDISIIGLNWHGPFPSNASAIANYLETVHDCFMMARPDGINMGAANIVMREALESILEETYGLDDFGAGAIGDAIDEIARYALNPDNYKMKEADDDLG